MSNNFTFKKVKMYNSVKNNDFLVRTFWSLLTTTVQFLKLLSPINWEQYEKYKVIYSRNKTKSVENTKSLSEWKQSCSDLCLWWSTVCFFSRFWAKSKPFFGQLNNLVQSKDIFMISKVGSRIMINFHARPSWDPTTPQDCPLQPQEVRWVTIMKNGHAK